MILSDYGWKHQEESLQQFIKLLQRIGQICLGSTERHTLKMALLVGRMFIGPLLHFQSVDLRLSHSEIPRHDEGMQHTPGKHRQRLSEQVGEKSVAGIVATGWVEMVLLIVSS